ncbi:MAG TPA: glycosyltransferase [Acidimicrobiales bacterium]|nr:glycosyltransferase [Acidimicrobiales bacterium]
MHVDLTVPSYAIAAVVAYYAALFALGARADARPPTRGPTPCFVLLVPARNEELVIAATIAGLTGTSYPGEWRVLVMNDASRDATGDVARAAARADDRVRVVDRGDAEGGRGKSSVLNHGFGLVSSWVASGDPWLAGALEDDVVVGIVDADGRLDRDCLTTVAPYFADPAVGTTQVGVRIANAGRSLLARMQDMEFVAFTWLVQVARDRIGSSGLGGNGQFVRLTALRSLGGQPWAPHALTEDLDLGLRLVERGWRTRFCQHTFVDQQGLESWRPLLRQRTRWIQGHYQCWRHIPRLLAARHVARRTRADLVAYLLLVVTVVLVTFDLAAALLADTGAISVTDRFLVGVVPYGLPYRVVSLTLSVLPLAIFTIAYQRHSPHRFRWYAAPAGAALFTLYTYVWAYATVRAWARIVTGRRTWTKTPRVALDAAPGTRSRPTAPSSERRSRGGRGAPRGSTRRRGARRSSPARRVPLRSGGTSRRRSRR